MKKSRNTYRVVACRFDDKGNELQRIEEKGLTARRSLKIYRELVRICGETSMVWRNKELES